MMLDLKNYIRDIPDFPKPGRLFRDITPLLADRQALAGAIYELAGPYHNQAIDAVVRSKHAVLSGAAVARVERFVRSKKAIALADNRDNYD
jgi:adenine/guanine phosphoribosyltransferase-like PRPP-binding protein